MLMPHGTVFAVVDGKSFELYRNTGMESAPQLRTIEIPDLEPTNFSAGFHHSDSASRHQARTGDGSNDQLDEFAHVAAVTQWLNKQVLDRNIEQLVVVADPKSLGEMRRHYHKELKAALIGEVPKTLTSRAPQDIVRALHG